MNDLFARLIKLEANPNNPTSYTMQFAVGDKTYTMALEADEEGLAVEPQGDLEEALDMFMDDEKDELSEEEEAKFVVGGFADWFVQMMSETGLLHGINAEELFGDGEDGEDEEEDED